MTKQTQEQTKQTSQERNWRRFPGSRPAGGPGGDVTLCYSSGSVISVIAIVILSSFYRHSIVYRGKLSLCFRSPVQPDSVGFSSLRVLSSSE